MALEVQTYATNLCSLTLDLPEKAESIGLYETITAQCL